MPGAGQGEGQKSAQVESEEGQNVGPVVLGEGSQQRLDEEEGGDGEDVPSHHPLRLGQPDVLGLTEGQGRGLLGVPADLLTPAAVDGEHDPGSTDEDDQRQDRPDHEVTGGCVADQGLGGPVVRVRVVVARALCGRSPGGPAEEGRHLFDLDGVGDEIRLEAVAVGVGPKHLGVVVDGLVVGLDLLIGPHQGSRGGVVAVGPHHLLGGGRRVGDPLGGELLLDARGLHAKVLGGEVRTEVAAVPQDGAVLHETSGLEELLPLGDVLRREESLTALGDHLLRLRHGIGVGAVGQQAHDSESEEHDQGDPLDPPLADEASASGGRPLSRGSG